jgi:hypothetical protein
VLNLQQPSRKSTRCWQIAGFDSISTDTATSEGALSGRLPRAKGGSKRKGGSIKLNEFSDTVLFGTDVHASWVLLPVGPVAHLITCCFGQSHCSRLLLNRNYLIILCSAPQGPSIQLGFSLLCHLHSSLWCHPSDGGLEHLASHLLVIRDSSKG